MELYRSYTGPEILAGFEGDGWTVVDDRLFGLCELAEGTCFPSCSDFSWMGPERRGVHDALEHRAGGHLFVRPRGAERYVYVADIRRVYSYGFDGERCTAGMSIEPAVPTDVLVELGDLYVSPNLGQRMNDAVAALRGAHDSVARIAAWRSFVEAWRGPVKPEEAMSSVDLEQTRFPIPGVLRAVFEWAGRCEDVMQGSYHRWLLPEHWQVYDREYVAVCMESQWCGNYFVRTDAMDQDDPEVLADECGEGRGGAGYTPLGIGLSQLLWVHSTALSVDGAPLSGHVRLEASHGDRLARALGPLPILGATELAQRRALAAYEPEPKLNGAAAFAFAGDGSFGSVLPEGRELVVSFRSRTDRAQALLLSRLGVDATAIRH